MLLHPHHNWFLSLAHTPLEVATIMMTFIMTIMVTMMTSIMMMIITMMITMMITKLMIMIVIIVHLERCVSQHKDIFVVSHFAVEVEQVLRTTEKAMEEVKRVHGEN